MKIKIVYFAYLIPNKWENIIKEQLDSLKKLTLYTDAVNIYMSVISDDIELEKLKNLIKTDYNRIEICNVYNENYYEYPGIQTIYKIAEDEDDTLLLYFHSKGMTSDQHETRQYLFKYTIENYEQYISEFNKNKFLDVAGAMPHMHGFIYFNFFWTRSSYVRNYCSKPKISDNRYIYEVWLGSEFSRKKDIITYSPIIKYDQIKDSNEVWNIHNRMIKNEFCYLLEKPIQKPIKLINGVINNKPIKINKKVVNEPISEPIKELTNDSIKESIKELTNEPIKELTNDSTTEKITDSTKIKPIKIDPNKGYQVPKPTKIIKKQINSINPYSIFEKLKNKNHIVIELGAGVGLNTCMISKRFKKVFVVENNKENIQRLESNIRNYCYKNIRLCKKQLMQIKNNINECITFKELIYYEVHKFFQNIHLIVCDMNGE